MTKRLIDSIIRELEAVPPQDVPIRLDALVYTTAADLDADPARVRIWCETLRGRVLARVGERGGFV